MYVSPGKDTYVGDFVNMKQHGKGKLVFHSGNTYEGHFAGKQLKSSLFFDVKFRGENYWNGDLYLEEW